MKNHEANESRLADLADLVLNVAREIRLQVDESAGVIPLTPSEGNVMRYIDRNPGASANGVADATGLRRSNLSGALRGLEAKGLVRRERHPNDRREVRIFPTDSAGANILRLREIWADRLAAALDQNDVTEISGTVALLARLESNLSKSRNRAAEHDD